MTIEAKQTPRITEQATLTIPVDAEHTGIRLAGCGSMFVVGGVVVALFALLFPSLLLAGIILGLVAAAGTAYGVEHWLKGRWRSGRVFQVTPNTIALRQNDTLEHEIDPTEPVNVYAWYFVVDRNTRIKKGWRVLGLALEQDDTLLPLYTFTSPEIFEEFPEAERFTRLERKQGGDSAVGGGKSVRLAGQQRRLMEAEGARGLYGAEVTLEEMQTILDHLTAHYPRWMKVR